MKIKTYRFAAAVAVLLALCLVFMAPVGAGDADATNYVAKIDDDDDYYSSLQYAVDNATSGSTITVSSGTITENIRFSGDKTLTILGANYENNPRVNKWDDATSTILTGGMYLGNDDSTTTVADTTITIKGIAFKNSGLKVGEQKTVIIENNTFENIVSGSAITVTDQSFSENSGSVTIRNNHISGVSDADNAGIRLRNSHSIILENNLIENTKHNSITIERNNHCTSTDGTVSITGNTMDTWGISGEGRAVRAALRSTVTFENNVMINDNAPEDFVKMTGVSSDPTVSGNKVNSKIAAGSYGSATYLINPVAVTETSAYDTLADAITAANADDTVTLLKDVNLGSSLTIEKSITLDLNGKELSSATDTIIVKGTSASLTVLDNSAEKTGRITTSAPSYGAIYIHSGARVTLNSGTLNSTFSGEGNSYAVFAGSTYDANKDSKTSFVMNGGKLEARDYGLCIYNGTAVINDGIISANMGISGNGGSGDGTTLTINGGSITGGDTGIYHPQNGLLIINGGTITGNVAVYFKSGSLEVSSITGGHLIGNGEKKSYMYYGSGFTSTGDALAIENVGVGGYQGISSISITGGTFTSNNAKAVASYVPADNSIYKVDKEGNTAELSKHKDYSELMSASRMTEFITGGLFSSQPDASYIKAGYEVVPSDGKYKVQEKKPVTTTTTTTTTTSKPKEEPPVEEPVTPTEPVAGEVTVETTVTNGGELTFETPAEPETPVEGESGEQGEAPTDAPAEPAVTGVVLPEGTNSEVAFVPISEQPAPAGKETSTKKVFEINVPTYEKGKPATIKFTMTVAELEADGKEAADVALWHFDEETGEWTKLLTSYIIVDGVVYFEAITYDFSPFAIIYEETPVDEPVEEPETPASPAPVLGLLAALGAAVVLRRK